MVHRVVHVNNNLRKIGITMMLNLTGPAIRGACQPHKSTSIVRFSFRGASSSSTTENQSNPKKEKKVPDLRRAAEQQNQRTSKLIIAACLVVVAFMYPTILRPLFNLGTLGDQQSKTLEEAKIDLNKHRPSNMPDWSSPFGPKEGDER